ncbi:MAG: asparagine synthase (glutamine-hydrolyzing) [Rhodospirillaceae bacterium]|nr:MAG: asparagine synthase (glutamine-hydrolyzing) [Rhodospirillaceae bacterium]
MCGFAGFVGVGTEDDIRSMTACLVHRGPDDEAFHVDTADRVSLGFRRLIVLDPAAGRQPMACPEHGLVVVFNGEIYNHAELRRELEGLGCRFRSSHSDTEVLLHGYATWGKDLPLHLDGMFAFAIWDKPRRRVFCARDRFGEKPFYYAATPNLFAFGSEITALHAHSGFSDSPDPAAVQKFFAYGYVPAPRTIYRLVRKLEPGTTLTYDLDTQEVRHTRYWRFAIEAEGDAPADRIPALAEELRALLTSAVSRRMEADVPLGVFLSGGIDSTVILALAARARGPAGIDSFTIGFREPSYDEAAFARAAAAAIGSRHHERIVDIGDARAELPALLSRLDEPFADPSILPTHLLARFAREHVTVALSGDGSDELFAGYDPFGALAPAALYRRFVPGPLHRLLRVVAGKLPRDNRNMSFEYRVRRALRGVSQPPSLWNPVWLGLLAPEEFEACFENPLPPEILFEEAIQAWTQSASRDPVDRTLEFYTNFYLPEMILAKADRASMRASLESRAPFLDRNLVAFCQRLPHGYKMRGGQRKFLLKEAFRGLVPDSVLARRKKGFGIPLVDWLGALEHLRAAFVPAGMRPAYADARWRGFHGKTEDERLFLWGHICLAQIASRS